MDSIDNLVSLVETQCGWIIYAEKNFDWRLMHRVFMATDRPLAQLRPDGWWTL